MGLKRDLVSDETARSVETQAVQVAKNLNAEYWSVSGKTHTPTQFSPTQYTPTQARLTPTNI